MKKLSYLIFVVILLYISISFASAQTQDPGDTSQVIGEEFGIDPEKIPASQEDIEKIRDEYLKKEWTEVVSKNKILGPIHNFLTKINPIFSVIFKHQYEISLTFFSIFVLWVLFMISSTLIARSLGAKGVLSVVIGTIFTIILAQIKLIESIVIFTLDLILKQENWWIRLILTIVTLGVFLVGYILIRILAKYIGKEVGGKGEDEIKQKLSELKGLKRGLEGKNK